MNNRYHYSYQNLYGNANKYDFVYYTIPTNSFVKKQGIVQKTFPSYHLYYPYGREIIENRFLYPIDSKTGKIIKPLT